jgi:CRISPR-associated endonuclease Cas1
VLGDTVPEDSPRAILHHIYTRDSTDSHVAIAHGYNVQLRVLHGHLVIRDGIGRHQRERKYPKADRTLKRIVITAPDGYVTLEALTWCAEHGITVTTLTPDCELVAHYATTDRATDTKLLRRQALAHGTDSGTEVARELLTRKVNEQAGLLLKLFNDSNTAGRLYHYAERMAESGAILQSNGDKASLSELEGWAARDYFATWVGKATVPFDARSLKRIPANWLAYLGRSSEIVGGGKKYNASDPVNAMLNYAYTLGYAECRRACVAHGLSPALGYIHADKPGRDSLALDVLEAIRPDIDGYVLGLLGKGSEPRKGQVLVVL